MKIEKRAGHPLLTVKAAFPRSNLQKMKMFGGIVLIFILIANVLPVAAGSRHNDTYVAANVQAVSNVTFTAVADARVDQQNPASNFGTQNYLQVVNANNRQMESYIRFSVSGVSGVVQSAKLRVYSKTNGTRDGPAVYKTSDTWTETGITWNNHPAPTTAALDNKGAISTGTWVEYNVSSVITGNGTYSFVLIGDSNDDVIFASREATNRPQLVITVNASAPTATPASLKTPTRTPTSGPTPTRTRTPAPTATTSSGSAVLVGAGDISSCSNNNDEATAKLLDGISGTVFTLGDNAYNSGTSTEYTNCYNPTWGRHKARTKPIPGNHDYNTSGASGYFNYFNNIAPYYAYTLGAWRIYALNSEIAVSSSSAQVQWLQSDLAAHPSQCVLAYWHKPRWSSGTTHGSASSMQTIWQILYNAGAELVISGHEHNYERFAQMNASGATVTSGLREIVVGTGGVGFYPFGTPLSTSQVRNNNTYGVLKLTLRSTGYDWQFVPVAGSSFSDSGSSNCH